MRVNLGCGINLLDGWVNADLHPALEGVERVDALAMPWPDGSVDELLAEHLFEHFAFAEEEPLWRECLRVLKPCGILTVETPDFEWACAAFSAAADDFREFYAVGAKDHYFGQNSLRLDQRWGLLATVFFGNQNGGGQVHKTCYTVGKLHAVAALVGFRALEVVRSFSKGAPSIRGRFMR